MADLTTLTWPAARLGEALDALARTAGLTPRAVEPLDPPAGLPWPGDEALGRWLPAAAGHLGLEAEPIEMPYDEVGLLLQQSGPALLRLPWGGKPCFLALLAGGRRLVSLLGPDLMVHRLRRALLGAALCHNLEAPLTAEVDRLLVAADVPRRRRPRARAAILRERLGLRSIGGCWLLRLPPGASFWQQARQARLPSRLLALVSGHAGQYLLWLLAWWMIGQGALQGRLDSGWLLAWVLLLVTLVPFRLLATWSQGRLAIGLGGMLLAYRAFHKLATGMWHLAGAVMAWEQVRPLFDAAARPEVGGALLVTGTPTSDADSLDGASTVLEAHELVFRYRDRGAPVLRGCNLRIRTGDRLLLEGPSGGGKSSLTSLLSGLRVPESGLLLLRGLDRHTLGTEGWRRRVVAAPQFHENHVLTEPFAFNLLMGRRWPPQPEDIEAAENVCRELGLDDLLSRMPAGLLQMVGEAGWQLSHGERSRLYMARALLQEADLVSLDESFAALDPETLQCCLRCVLQRVPTLLVIAQPSAQPTLFCRGHRNSLRGRWVK